LVEELFVVDEKRGYQWDSALMFVLGICGKDKPFF
jgi:hypothetical protein